MTRLLIPLVALSLACDPVPAADGAGADAVPTATSTIPQPLLERAASRGWSVSTVTDGDTIDVVRGGTRLTVRVIGINAPETDECIADRATRTMRALVQDGPLTLRRDVSDRDIYGRALRYVINAEGRDVGARMIRRGLAWARRYEPDVARADRYSRLQARARAAERGLWSPSACGPATRASIEVTGLRADALGDDNDNLNDEWVQFTNVGDAAVDMTGWTVADESASHRYVFGAFQLRGGAEVTLFSGCGSDRSSVRHWCSSGAVWNNDGDTVFLRDRNGSLVVGYAYPS